MKLYIISRSSPKFTLPLEGLQNVQQCQVYFSNFLFNYKLTRLDPNEILLLYTLPNKNIKIKILNLASKLRYILNRSTLHLPECELPSEQQPKF